VLCDLAALQSLPVPHQTLLFSATMPREIEQLAAQYLNKPVKVKIGRVSVPTANVAQQLQRCSEAEKVELLLALLQVGGEGARRNARSLRLPPFELWVQMPQQGCGMACWLTARLYVVAQCSFGRALIMHCSADATSSLKAPSVWAPPRRWPACWTHVLGLS